MPRRGQFHGRPFLLLNKQMRTRKKAMAKMGSV